MEFACSPSVYVGFFPVLCVPPTVKDMHIRLIGHFKLHLCVDSCMCIVNGLVNYSGCISTSHPMSVEVQVKELYNIRPFITLRKLHVIAALESSQNKKSSNNSAIYNKTGAKLFCHTLSNTIHCLTKGPT